VSGSRRHIRFTLLHGVVAIILACNYFAFQVELFEDEYEASHGKPDQSSSLAGPLLTWESVDKDYVQEPFVFDAIVQFDLLFTIPSESRAPEWPGVEFHPVRDKSPPPLAS
jgi:hypothetical protein